MNDFIPYDTYESFIRLPIMDLRAPVSKDQWSHDDRLKMKRQGQREPFRLQSFSHPKIGETVRVSGLKNFPDGEYICIGQASSNE